MEQKREKSAFVASKWKWEWTHS